MSIIVRVPSRIPVVKTGFSCYVPNLYYRLGSPGSYLQYAIVTEDPVCQLLANNNFYCPAGAASLDRIFGLDFGLEARDTTVKVAHKPIVPTWPYDTYDSRVYENNSQGLSLLVSTLSGKSIKAPSTAGENPVRHYTYSGELMENEPDIPFVISDSYFMGFSYKVRQNLFMTETLVVDDADVSVMHLTNRNHDLAWSWNILDFLDAFKSKEFNQIYWDPPYTYSHRLMSGLEYDLSPERLIIRYHTEWFAYLYSYQTYKWDSEIRFEFQNASRDIVVYDGLSLGPREGPSSSTFRYKNGSHTYEDGMLGPVASVSTGFPISCNAFSGLRDHTMAEHDTYAYAPERLSNRIFLEKFRKDVESGFSDIVPSIMFSTADAFSKARESINTDVFQTLAKVPVLYLALPHIREAVSILGSLVKRDLSFATLRDILDLATSTTLQASFVWRPYLSLFTDLIPQMVSILQTAASRSSSLAIGRGSFSFKILNEFGRKEITLLTRTKLVMDTSSSGLLSAILSVDDLGILPKPSNIWDTLPFTFVVNWFTGVTQSMRRAERSLELLTVPAYYVHSFTLTSPLTDDELDVLKASSVSPSPASLRLYFRDVSLYCPYPKDSRLGFGLPPGVPSVGIWGSLLYQLVFSR